MKQYKVHITETAESELLDAAAYIAGKLFAPRAAEDLLDEFEKVSGHLAVTPHIHALVDIPEFSALGYRKLFVKNYVAFFVVDEATKTVNVERILHVRRNWPNLL